MINKVWSWGYTRAVVMVLSSLLIAPGAYAGTLVRIGTSLGDYTLELLDDIAPITVQNFLNYVNRDAYDSTFIHRSEANALIQGGGYGFELFVGPIPVVEDPPIVNEFSTSNTRGTVAMAKFANDPNSATSQWFVNIADNSSELDTQNEGFTVFATVLGEGMDVIDSINALPTPVPALGILAPSAPFITEVYRNPLDLVYINAEVVERFSGAAHVYEVNSGKLISAVNVDNGESLVALNFDTVSTSPEVVISANPKSIIRKRDSFDEMATYSTSDGRLRIPSLEVFDGRAVSILRNVVFVLSAPAANQFVLESFDQ